MKKYLLILSLLIVSLPLMAAPNNQGGYVGTPPGFYDDIDPNTLDNGNENMYEYDNVNNNKNKSYTDDRGTVLHEYSDDDEIIIGAGEQTQSTKNYAQIYNNLEPASFSYLHGIDPDEYYDTQNAAWSIYPLLRLKSAIYFKNQVIEPGYYLLTPREHKGQWYILFKQNGKVIHIIPVYERGTTPVHFYEEHIPEPKLTRSQKWHLNRLEGLGNRKHSKRKQPVKSFLEVDDLDNYFINIKIYYDGHSYSTLFRSIRL